MIILYYIVQTWKSYGASFKVFPPPPSSPLISYGEVEVHYLCKIHFPNLGNSIYEFYLQYFILIGMHRWDIILQIKRKPMTIYIMFPIKTKNHQLVSFLEAITKNLNSIYLYYHNVKLYCYLIKYSLQCLIFTYDDLL